MKTRLSGYMTLIETLSEEIKRVSKEANDISASSINEEDPEKIKEMAIEHFFNTQLLTLMNQDLNNTTIKLVECYTNAVLTGTDKELTKEEVDILNNYTKDSVSLFVVDKGKLESKNPELIKKVKDSASGIVNKDFYQDYVKNYLKSK